MAQRGVNKAILLGHIGNDPEIRTTQSGDCVANFTVATSEVWTDKNGTKQDKTEWHKIAAFGKIAEIIQKYTHKGSKIYLEGRLQTRKWTAQDGSDRYATEIVMNEVQLLDRKETDGNGNRPQQTRPAQANGNRSPQQPAVLDYDDDLSF